MDEQESNKRTGWAIASVVMLIADLIGFLLLAIPQHARMRVLEGWRGDVRRRRR